MHAVADRLIAVYRIERLKLHMKILKSKRFPCGAGKCAVRYPSLIISVILDMYAVKHTVMFGKIPG